MRREIFVSRTTLTNVNSPVFVNNIFYVFFFYFIYFGNFCSFIHQFLKIFLRGYLNSLEKYCIFLGNNCKLGFLNYLVDGISTNEAMYDNKDITLQSQSVLFSHQKLYEIYQIYLFFPSMWERSLLRPMLPLFLIFYHLIPN